MEERENESNETRAGHYYWHNHLSNAKGRARIGNKYIHIDKLKRVSVIYNEIQDDTMLREHREALIKLLDKKRNELLKGNKKRHSSSTYGRPITAQMEKQKGLI